MSPHELNPLIKAEQLFETGEFEKAFKLLKDFENIKSLTLSDKLTCRLFRIDLLFQQGRYQEVFELAEETYNQSLGLEKKLLTIDSLIWMARALIFLFRLDKASNLIIQGEELLKSLPKEVPTNYKQREAFIAFTKGYFYQIKGNINCALEYHEHSLALREVLGIKHEIAESLGWISFLLIWYKGEFDRAFKYAQRSLALAKDSTKKFYIGFSFTFLAAVYSFQGEVDRCIILFEQSLAIFKEINNKRRIAVTLNNVGEKYRMKGDLDRALEYLEQSLAILQEFGNSKDFANTHDFLIQILIDKGDLKVAERYLKDLKQLNNKLQNKQINLMYLFDKALLLKTSLRARNRVKAEEIFNQLLEDKDLDYELTIRTLLNLCELHLIELHMINDIDILDDINPLIVRLLDIAEKSHSYWIQSETYLLQAKLALLTFDINKAQRFLIQSQKIAESHGLKQLVMKISYEYDELIKKLKIWENFKETEASLSERWKLAGLNEQMQIMVKKRAIELPELSEEEPITIFIITEGGTPLFSHSFIVEKSFESHLFGGFLTTINYFIREMFSEGLDRAIFGEYTLLMKSIAPFFISYIFKGDSYYAHQKINTFTDNIQKEENVWQKLIKSFETNQTVHLEDIPSLEPLIEDIFIKKIIY